MCEETKFCSGCGETKKAKGNFYYTKRDGWYVWCKACSRKKNNSRSADYRRKEHLKSKYGLTGNEFDDMLDRQSSKCEICKCKLVLRTGGFAVDHCHSTGKVRSILCLKCNLILGYSRDNREILQKAIEYLSHHSSSAT